MDTPRGARGKWLPGHSPNPAGKPKGAITKRTAEFQETLAKHNFNAAEALLELYAKAQEGLEYGDRDEKPKYLKIAADLAMDIADRVYPRLKSIEHKTDRPTDSLTPQQRLEMLKAATQALENDINQHGRSVGPGSGDNESDKPGGPV